MAAKKDTPQLLGLADACSVVRVPYLAGWAAVVAGRVPGAVKQGKRWLVDSAALLEAVTKQPGGFTHMSHHPSRTDRRTMKIQRSDGIVIERACVSAGAIVDQNVGWRLVDASETSVRELVEALAPDEICRRLAALGVVPQDEQTNINKLTTAVEDGAVVL